MFLEGTEMDQHNDVWPSRDCYRSVASRCLLARARG